MSCGFKPCEFRKTTHDQIINMCLAATNQSPQYKFHKFVPKQPRPAWILQPFFKSLFASYGHATVFFFFFLFFLIWKKKKIVGIILPVFDFAAVISVGIHHHLLNYCWWVKVSVLLYAFILMYKLTGVSCVNVYISGFLCIVMDSGN